MDFENFATTGRSLQRVVNLLSVINWRPWTVDVRPTTLTCLSHERLPLCKYDVHGAARRAGPSASACTCFNCGILHAIAALCNIQFRGTVNIVRKSIMGGEVVPDVKMHDMGKLADSEKNDWKDNA